MKNSLTNGKITRWLFLLKGFEMTIIDIPRKDIVVGDFLSRLTNTSDESPVVGCFGEDLGFPITSQQQNLLIAGPFGNRLRSNLQCYPE